VINGIRYLLVPLLQVLVLQYFLLLQQLALEPESLV
jgi:hypothetical protein